MDDLVEQLDKRANTYSWDSATFYISDANMMRQAAAEIRSLREQVAQERAYPIGTRVRKVSGPEWDGVVVGYYSSTFTPEGLVIECTAPGAKGQVHVEPTKRIERHEENNNA
jgi:hypothetical protein